jgi:Family of unknown function (DUF6261)
MIYSIDLPKLRNPEYLQFEKDFVAIATRNNPSALQITTKLDALNLKTIELDNLFVKVLANENTQVLVNIDENRDKAINGITFTVTGLAYHFDENIRNAAQKILDNLALYGSGIAKLNYLAETSVITNIINDWETKPVLIDALNVLNLTNWKDYLKTQNNLFNEVYLNRTQEYGNASLENFKGKREETNVAYYALRDRINALHTLVETPPSPYSTIINELNALIEQYNTLINNRAAGSMENE